MAITGLIGIGFVLVHMIGNLKMYLGVVDGEYDIDVYGEFLRELLVPLLPRTYALWMLRLVLIGALILHLHAAYTLTIINRRARPVGYQSKRDYVAADFAARTMRWTGIIVVLFLFFHLADLTWGWFNPDFVRGEVYRNVDASLSRIPVAILYIVANIALGIHLFHGTWSLFQSMGWNNPRFNPWRRGHRHRRSPRSSPSATCPSRSPCKPASSRSEVAMTVNLDDKVPAGPLADKWDTFIADSKLVNPNNKRKFKIIVVGTGLAGASAAATLAELGYQVHAFTFHDSPRRAHSIAAQGGINASKNYRGDGDSIHRLFYDTIKGGDFRSREGNVYRLAQVSGNIIDQCVAQGVPFAREYGGLLDNRSFGGAQVSRTFYVGGQTGQQLLLGAYQQMARQVGLGNVTLWNRMELVDIVVVDGRCAGIVCRDLLTGEFSSHNGHAVVLATGGYGNAFFLSTNAMACNVTAAWRAHRKGALFANPCYTQIHPTCIPQSDEFQSKLTLMSESLRNDGRVWVPKEAGDDAPAGPDPRGRARLLPRAAVPELRQPRPARHLLAGGQARRRLRPRRRAEAERRVPRLRRRHRPPRRQTSSASATGTSSRCTSGSPARTRTRSRCASTRRRTTRWAGSGSTTS